MANPYLGEIRLAAFNFAPEGWAFCNGTLLSISQNDTLFTLIGTTYGGDGQSTFGLPDLQGRVPIHVSASIPLGSPGGTEGVQLDVAMIPTHSHPTTMCASGTGNSAAPTNGGSWAATNQELYYSNFPPSVSMAANALATAGTGQSHENRQPSLAINYIIALQGIYPTPN